jgi:hypothetical protein
MATKDMYNNASPAQTLAPAARTLSANGVSVDLKGFESVLVLIATGAWTDGSHTFEVQESDDNATFTPVADADLQGTEPVIDAGADGNQVYKVGYIGSKRYVRVVTTVSGTTTGAVYGVEVVRGHARHMPVS